MKVGTGLGILQFRLILINPCLYNIEMLGLSEEKLIWSQIAIPHSEIVNVQAVQPQADFKIALHCFQS